MMNQNKKNSARMIEIVMVGIFIILWLMLISGHRLADNPRWENFLEKIPVRVGLLKDAGEAWVNHANNELVPLLSYEEYMGEDNVLLPFFHYVIQTEVFPIQQYSVDYWNGNNDFSSLYSDKVPDYFTESDDESVESKKTDPGNMDHTGTGKTYSLSKLSDYKFLLDHFYIVDETTTMTKTDLNGKKLLKTDLSVKMAEEEPLVLIYHTHGSESYKKEKGKTGSVVEVGKKLKEELEEKYGISVIHDTSIYDQVNGKLDRNAAYNYAGDSVLTTLKKHPSIQVILDLHRDSVEDSIHLVTEINGKKTAQIMFFNGVSRLKNGEIDYLYNPNKAENLAFSLQMQLLAAKYYPDYTRKIYIKGYRYNLHLAKRAMLVEVGAQNNTVTEAKNAMIPLAELLYRLLSGEKAYQ